MTSRGLKVAVLFFLFTGIASVAMAASADNATRFFIAFLEPSSDFSGDLLGTTVTVEADSTIGLSWFYEYRLNPRIGLEMGIVFVEFDFDESVAGVSGSVELGQAFALPVTFGLDVHLLGEDSKLDLYAGPLIAYTLWGNLDFSPMAGGGMAELDDQFGLGAVVGLDVPFGAGGWQFNAALRYLTLSAEDPSVELEIDPLNVEVGFGYRF